MTDDLQRAFEQIFCGYEFAHGEHKLFSQPDASGKLKGDAKTVAVGAGSGEYYNHLHGLGTSLGVIPLLSDDSCWWGAIDIDIKGETALHESIEALEARVRKLELPLVVCRSKSGGAHLYLFGSHPIAAKVMQSKLTEFALSLGYGGCEIFPKQTTRVNEEDRGNWINIAMYGVLSEEGTTRYAVRNGKPLKDLETFIDYVEMMRVSQKSLSTTTIKLGADFQDGPPCLQYFATAGLSEGGRNIALLNVAIYFKLKNDNDWQDPIRKFNQEHMDPPLPASEVEQIINNNRKDKKYRYLCKQPPLCNHCVKKICVKREFGVAFGNQTDNLFPLDNLTRCISKGSVRWYAEYEGCRVELTTDQLLSSKDLQKVFMERFAKVIIPGKFLDWQLKLQEMMQTCTDVIDPDDASRQGQFENLLDNFFSASRPARNKDELIKGNSYTEEGKVHFRSEDLLNYLNSRRFTHTPHEVWMWLKESGATAKQLRIKGKMIRVWALPEPSRFDGAEISLPTALEVEM